MVSHDLHIDLRRVTAAVSLLAGIVEGSDDAIMAKDRAGTIISWNPAAQRLFGYTEAEAIGSHVSMLVPDSHRGEDIAVFERILAGQKVEHYETTRCTKSGGLVAVAVTVSALRGADGTIVGASKSVRDITDVQAARQMEAQLAAIIENSDDAIISKDPRGRITSWNPAAERIFGFTPEEAVGQHISIIFPDDLIGRERDILGEILAGGKVDHYETRRKTKDGRILDVALTVSPLRGGDGGIIGASKILRDITEAKRHAVREEQARELERANQRLAAADRAKDEFLAIANHELRTPLTAIAGFTDTLLHREADLDAGQRREFLEIIDRQSARLARLIDDLMTLTKTQVDRSGSETATIAVRETVSQILHDQDRDDIRVTGDGGVLARVDPDRLRQIVLNFVDNAIKYGAGPIGVDVRQSATNVIIAVSDHGPGVAADILPHLFDAFTRAQGVRESQMPGTGLGLSIARSLARADGGDAWYEPNAGGGSRFGVRLPLEGAHASAPEPADHDAVGFSEPASIGDSSEIDGTRTGRPSIPI
jgi:PAS domain S-box-containing protein